MGMAARPMFILQIGAALALTVSPAAGWSETLSIGASPAPGAVEAFAADGDSIPLDATQNSGAQNDAPFALGGVAPEASPEGTAAPADSISLAAPQQSRLVRALSYLLQFAGR